MGVMEGRSTRIRLEQLELTTCIGVSEAERRRPQRLLADIDVWCDTAAAMSDDVNDSVDYAQLAVVLRNKASAATVKLLERLAAILCDAVLASSSAAWEVRVRLYKPGIIPRCGAAIVEAEERRNG